MPTTGIWFSDLTPAPVDKFQWNSVCFISGHCNPLPLLLPAKDWALSERCKSCSDECLQLKDSHGQCRGC